ncbi:lysozyme inhibitor LprI family protein [Wohlfahrtiimonas larvae]|uniref:Lysozyme inhibitor LprI-like N-terminal domain-containing protein n=1 Tax=Wohlfahrtiimonas larvae TaxID=1157986 RepID=A0ABP9MMQ1_9GAMM|nr:lysozyme inhibitor LprI family protein [Wohlfahrtiimonas larvae]
MKNIFFTILLLGNLTMSFAVDRFPILIQDHCSTQYTTTSEIYQCTNNNFYAAQEALAIFYINIHLFLPNEYKQFLQDSQSHWEKFSLAECMIDTYRFNEDPETQKIAEKQCLTHRIKSRIQHLIYIVMIWEEKLGSFKIVLEQSDKLPLPFTQQDQ